MSVSPQPVQNAAAVRAIRHERTAWFVLTILLLFSIAAPLNQFKVPPIMPILMGAFKLSVGRAGLLMSMYAVTGLVLALPAGLIFQKLGYRITGLIAGGSIAVGAILGATSSGVVGMLTSRVIEGIGTSFMAVLAPAMGIMMGQNAGILLGPIIFGALAESAGSWTSAFSSLAVMCLLGALACQGKVAFPYPNLLFPSPCGRCAEV